MSFLLFFGLALNSFIKTSFSFSQVLGSPRPLYACLLLIFLPLNNLLIIKLEYWVGIEPTHFSKGGLQSPAFPLGPPVQLNLEPNVGNAPTHLIYEINRLLLHQFGKNVRLHVSNLKREEFLNQSFLDICE